MYDPKEFDKIRERMNGGNAFLERLAIWSFFAFVFAVVGITLLFASKASALETYPINFETDYSKTGIRGYYKPDSSYAFGNQAAVRLTETLWVLFSPRVSPYWYYAYDFYSGSTQPNFSALPTPGAIFSSCYGSCGNLAYCGIKQDDGYLTAISRPIAGSIRLAEIYARWSGSSCSFKGGGIISVLYDAWDGTVLDSRHTGSSEYSSTNTFYAYHNGALRRVANYGGSLVYSVLQSDKTWSVLATVAKPPLMTDSTTMPQLLYSENFSPGTEQPTFFYRGTDGHFYMFAPFNGSAPFVLRMDTGEYSDNSIWAYILDTFGLGLDDMLSFPSLYNKRPHTVLEPENNNFLMISQDYSSSLSGSSIAALNKSLVINGYFENEPYHIGGTFINPKLYIPRLDVNNSYGVYDLACVEPGFDLCQTVGGTEYKCVNSLGNPGPNNITCNSPLEILPYTPGGGGSSSGGGGSSSGGGGSSSGGGNCIGSGCITQGTGSGAISGLSNFFEYVSNCDYDGSGDVTITEGIICIPGSIARLFGGIVDRLSAAWSNMYSIVENLLKSVTPNDTGSKDLFSFLIPKASAEEGNPMVNAVKNQIHDVADGDSVFSRIVDFVYWGLILVGVLIAAYSIVTLKRG